MSNLDNVNWCGTSEIVIFVLTVFFGTAYAVSCKVLLSLNGTDEEDGSTHIESFHKPLFEAFGMLVGMTLALLLHWAVMIFKIDFPGYDFDKQEKVHTTNDEVDYNYRTNGAEHPAQAPKPKSYILTSKTTSVKTNIFRPCYSCHIRVACHGNVHDWTTVSRCILPSNIARITNHLCRTFETICIENPITDVSLDRRVLECG